MRVELFQSGLMFLTLSTVLSAVAQKDPYVGEVAMSPKKTLLENLSTSPIHTELVEAIHKAQMDALLNGGGPYTVFAPTDDAFGKTRLAGPQVLPTGSALDALVKDHVVQGKLTAKQLGKRVKKGHGVTTLQTLAGEPLLVKRYGSILVLTDAKGGTATLITPDVQSKGGTFHVIDAVLQP